MFLAALASACGSSGHTAPSAAVTSGASPVLGTSPSAPSAASQIPAKTASVSATSSKAAAPPSSQASSAGCAIFTPDNIWHRDISALPVAPRSATYIASIGAAKAVHADFGSGTYDGAPFGIPVTDVSTAVPAVPVTFDYAGESDPGPYRIPPTALVEGGPAATGDRHVVVFDHTRCADYELWNASRRGDGSWTAGSGAVFDLRSDRLRPAGWTSADAAGLPVLAGLVRYDEVAAGRVDHMIRVTVPRSANSYLWPARHAAGSADPSLPPMGLVLRLKAGVDISRLPPQARVIAQALKTHGAIVADNGSAWYITGTQDSRWDNDQLSTLKQLTGADFEAVDLSASRVSTDSGQAR